MSCIYWERLYQFILEKRKNKCFKLLQGISKFQSTFATLRNDWNISDGLLTKLEEFVCRIYGMRKKDMNEVRFVKYQNENKMVDIKTLPSCRLVLLLHSKTANDVACIWGPIYVELIFGRKNTSICNLLILLLFFFFPGFVITSNHKS